MAPVSRLGRRIKEIILCPERLGAATALIGGLAVVVTLIYLASTSRVISIGSTMRMLSRIASCGSHRRGRHLD